MDRSLVAIIAFLGLGALFTAIEALAPARRILHRKVIGYDIAAVFLYVVFFQAAVLVTDRLPVPNYVPAAASGIPLVVKLLLFYLVEDFGYYWIHRLMHTARFWRVHRWHHSPAYMYWLAGVRATFPQCVLFNLPFIAALPILHSAPAWVFLLVLIEHLFRNDWMHMNVSWDSSWLEWLIVTPRYHHIHHSELHEHQASNLGSLLTVWDRLFGTYVNPGLVKDPLTFGIKARTSPIRLVLGI